MNGRVVTLCSIIAHMLGIVTAIPPNKTPPTAFNLTAITANDRKESVLECWQLDAPFQASAAAGTKGAVFAQLGQANMTSFGIIPSHFDGGLHTAPAMQYVVFLSGLATISLPNTSDTTIIPGGKHGVIFAGDTPAKSKLGHYTNYTGSDNTIAIQIPTFGNVEPPHTVLYDGPCCYWDEQVY